ncbi:hypothetical protein HY622_00910 [Candidatus Uhrbacteria bacterium]|nr:hypothetical protein [Candidatus Uhrbacteria bacterium]
MFVFILFCAVALSRAAPSDPVATFNQVAASDRSTQQRPANPDAQTPGGFSVEARQLTARQELALANAPFLRLLDGLDDQTCKRFGLSRDDIELTRRHVYQMVLAREVVSYDSEVLFDRFAIVTNEAVALSAGMTIVLPKLDEATLGTQLFVYRESIRLGITDATAAFERRTKIRCRPADATPSKEEYSIPVQMTERLAAVPRVYAGRPEGTFGNSTIGRVAAKLQDVTYIPEFGIYHRSMTDVRILLSVEEMRNSLRALQEGHFSPSAITRFMRERVAKVMTHELFHTIGVFHSRRTDDLMYPQYQPYAFKAISRTRPVTVGSLLLFFPYGPQAPAAIYRVMPWTLWVEQEQYVEVMDSVDGDPADDPSDVVARALYAITAKIISPDSTE